MGRCVHHLGIALPDDQFIQALKPHGVSIVPLDEVRQRIKVIYRPLA